MILALLLLSHSISDFILQTPKIIEKKENLNIKGFLIHGGQLLLTSIVLLSFYKVYTVLHWVLLMVLIHMIIDMGKNFLNRWTQKKDALNFTAFIVDQLLHLLVIKIIASYISVQGNMMAEAMSSFFYFDVHYYSVILKKLSIIIYIGLSGAYVIPLFLNIIYSKIEDYTVRINELALKKFSDHDKELKDDSEDFIEESRIGKWIGILERFLILFFISKGEYMSITIIIAVKSLTRYKLLNYKIFAEYYLLGTLASLIYSITSFYVLLIIL